MTSDGVDVAQVLDDGYRSIIWWARPQEVHVRWVHDIVGPVSGGCVYPHCDHSVSAQPLGSALIESDVLAEIRLGVAVEQPLRRRMKQHYPLQTIAITGRAPEIFRRDDAGPISPTQIQPACPAKAMLQVETGNITTIAITMAWGIHVGTHVPRDDDLLVGKGHPAIAGILTQQASGHSMAQGPVEKHRGTRMGGKMRHAFMQRPTEVHNPRVSIVEHGHLGYHWGLKWTLT